MDRNIAEDLIRIESKFNIALSEFSKQSGYIEGTLDTVIATNVDANPEISMIADRLVKTFHSIEGVCKQGISLEFKNLLDLCKELAEENSKLIEEKSKPKEIDLDSAIAALKKTTRGKNGK
jgi:hypothetical protein